LEQVPLLAASLIPFGPVALGLDKDKTGQLWAATHEGVLRFGEENDIWQLTEIGDHSVFITPDEQGGVWALSHHTWEYLSYFDGERWQHYSGYDDRHCGVRQSAVADVGPKLWVTDQCGLHVFDGQQWTTLGGFEFERALLERGPDGKLYAILKDGRVQRYDGVTWEVITTAEQYRFAPPGAALVVDRQGGVWVGANRAPYLRYFAPAAGDLDGAQWHEFPDFVKSQVHALLIDSRGDLWVGGEGALLRYDGQSWESHPDITLVWALGEDWQGRIWAGSYVGLYAYDPRE
jgi:ligand-binding sensor domain-containing protein